MFQPNYPHTDSTFTLHPVVERINAPPEFTGRGVVMAFIDSGFSPHPEILDRVLAHVDATTERIIERTRYFHDRDFSWHGQMTSVIAAGDGRTSQGRLYRGIAPDTKLILIKVSNLQGRIKEPDILRGMRWLLRHHARFGVRVVNVSVGGDDPNDDPDYALHRAVHDLHKAGMVVTIAAGNANAHSLVPPASAPEAITVGGYDDHNQLDRTQWTLYHHNYGTAYDKTAKPEVSALAAWVASPILPGSSMAREARWLAMMLRARDKATIDQMLLSGYGDLSLSRGQAFKPDEKTYALLQARINAHKIIDSTHQHVDGTSVSAAVVAGVAALMIEANPRLTPTAIKEILMATAAPLPNIPVQRQNAGVIDAAAAVRAAKRDA